MISDSKMYHHLFHNYYPVWYSYSNIFFIIKYSSLMFQCGPTSKTDFEYHYSLILKNSFPWILPNLFACFKIVTYIDYLTICLIRKKGVQNSKCLTFLITCVQIIRVSYHRHKNKTAEFIHLPAERNRIPAAAFQKIASIRTRITQILKLYNFYGN